MQVRRHFKQALSLDDHLRMFSEQLKAKAAKLQPGRERDVLLRRASAADTASHINEWANSSGLQAPK